ncbi:MAG: hypothetical protein EAZ24_04745 [Burkholderiales bacterium]|nr:MAG: hypothetical protein EAZ21_14480 [Betaproteobacteria bacterium]TAG80917.1 MAG: hypothetical protein EAZ24_04745 [Burkholderiales bacterium]
MGAAVWAGIAKQSCSGDARTSSIAALPARSRSGLAFSRKAEQATSINAYLIVRPLITLFARAQ